MEFISEELLNYCETHSAREPELLKQLNRETHLKISQPRMLSGHIQGRLLSMMSHLVHPTHILEIGTYTGYSALCMAEGLSEKGELISIDPNEETLQFAKRFIDRSDYKDKIRLMCGDAASIIPELSISFDLVFIDADKKSYSRYFDLVINKVNTGGIIIADNVLWSGKVLDLQKDKETQLIHEFNLKVHQDERVEVLMLPVRDGLTILRKL